MGNTTTASVTGAQVAPAKSAIKDLPIAKVWAFAAGQFGWALLSGIISNWLVYFYQPDQETISQGQTVFVPQGLVVLGIVTVVGGITAFARFFDAFVDPAVAFVCVLVPPLAIREKDYVNSRPTSESAIESLKQTFGDGEFRKFVCSDVVYWVAITTFQTGLPFFVTSLLKLPETTTTIYFVLMTGVSTVGMASGAGYRIAAVCAAVLCGLGGIVFAFYNEKKVLGVLEA